MMKISPPPPPPRMTNTEHVAQDRAIKSTASMARRQRDELPPCDVGEAHTMIVRTAAKARIAARADDALREKALLLTAAATIQNRLADIYAAELRLQQPATGSTQTGVIGG